MGRGAMRRGVAGAMGRGALEGSVTDILVDAGTGAGGAGLFISCVWLGTAGTSGGGIAAELATDTASAPERGGGIDVDTKVGDPGWSILCDSGGARGVDAGARVGDRNWPTRCGSGGQMIVPSEL